MKKITFLSVLLLSLFSISQSFSQKVVVVGMNHATPDGFSFVVATALTASEVVYFTEDEYNNGTGLFSSGESVVQYTADVAGLAVGQVVFVKETSTNTFTVTCTNGSTCGSAVATSIPFSIGSSGDSMYAYSDVDTDPTNGVTEIYSVMYTLAGSIPALEDPTAGAVPHPTAVVVDGFASGTPNRTEYMFSPASVRDGVSQALLENPANYLNGVANADLSLVEFTNLNLAGANPVLTVAVSPTSVLENSGTGMVYTFTLDAPAVGAITVNFSVGGTATFTTDYTQSGADTFNATTGTATIPNAGTTVMVTLTPVGDTGLEPDETAILSITAGTGYDAGSPSSATGTITNDDTMSITPVVAVTGTTHSGAEGFSFVALDDIPGGVIVYFTENAFDNTLLTFSGAEAVVSWTSPGGGVLRGEVIVATEGPPNTFTATCNSGTCGTVALVSGSFDLASDGEAFFAYGDTDTIHTNGITQIDAVLYTGVSGTPGGSIPAIEDPSVVYIGAVVVDGFAATPPIRTEYDPSLRGVTVDQANFQNTTNWLHAAAAATLDTTPFANIIIATGSANPTATLTVAPTSVLEDSGTGMVYTFMLDAPAVGTITVNFTVGGTATFTTDYTQTGAATFTASTGSVDILNGNTSATVTVTAVVDTDVEPAETVILMLASGTGYDGGSPNSATATINNDDTSMSDPLVAVMGMSHAGPDGFSFVAAKDVPAGTVVYFTEDEFDNTTLLFSSGESVLQWTSPAGGQIDEGDVIVVTETAPDVFAVTCSDTSGNGCGTIAVIVGGFALATNGETLTAYEDSDTDPTNGVDDIYGVMYTGNAGTPGGNLPAIEDPTGIYLSALVVDGFPAVAPDKTEYTPAGRAIPVAMADFENPANYDHAFAYGAGLSTVPFADLNIVDTTPPVITCPANATVECGDDTSPASTGTATATDDVDPTPTITFADTSVAGCGLTEVITRTWTATDDAGNSSSCVQTITVVDTTDPTISCPANATVECGDDTSSASTGVATGTDGCGTVTITESDTSVAGCGLTEIITRTWTATDECGNTATCVQTITVVDTTDPVITCPANATVECGDDTSPTATGTATGTDGCGTVTITFADSSAAGCGLTETITRTWTATDECGNTDTCVQTITVVDTTLPTITCPANITVNNDAGVCGAVVTYTAPVGSDTCGTSTTVLIAGLGSGATFPVGTTTETYEVTDDCGNVETCSFTVTVNDTEDPVVTCPADITVSNDPGQCDAVVSFMATATDNCPGVTTSSVPASGSVFPVGTTTVTVTATDASGNTDVCTFDITVDDNEDPVIICPADITVSNDPGSCDAVVTYATPVGTDNCPGESTVQTAGLPSGATFPVGTTTNTFVVTDAAGNTATCSFDVTVNDNEDPIIACPGDFNVSNDPGVCGAVVNYGVGFGDNCPGATLAQTAGLPSGSTFPIGTTTNTFVVTDASGNTATCSFDVTVNDTEPPVITCPADIIVSNDPGVCEAVVNYTVTATDNCPGETVVQTAGLPSGSAFPVGTTTNTFVVTDASGNSATCSFDVTVIDDEDPVITCPADITVSNDPGVCGAVVNYTVTATDNCDALATNVSSLNPLKDNTIFQEIPGNSNGAGQLMYVGQNGVGANNRGLLTFDIAGSIPLGSTITAVSLTMTADHPTATNGAHVFDLHRLLEDWGEGASDNGIVPGSGGGGFGVAAIAPDATWIDAILGTPWAGGAGGNFNPASSAAQTVDLNGPYIWSSATLVSDVQDMLDNPGTNFGWAVIGNETVAGTTKRFGTRESGIPPVLEITYNSAGGTLTLTQTAGLPSGSVFPIGTTTNTFVATDSAGNTDTCSFDVTVNDTEPPIITCPADITVNNDPGLCSAVVTYVITTSDNCPGETVAQTAGLPSGSAFPVGTTTNVFIVTDASGNMATCSFNVTVIDNEPPVAMCVAPFTIQLDANGMASITAADVDNGSTDNCGIASLDVSPGMFTCADVGPNTVTLTVTDVNGNVSTCTTTVTVEDNVPPVAVCMDIDVFLDATGNVSITPADVDGGSTDACGIASLSIDIMDFTCADIGPNNVTLTVTDNNGNVSTCVAVVTVIDAIPPTISCPADIFTSTDPSICGAVVVFPDAIALDNCAVTVAQTGGPVSGSVFPVGVTTIEYTATDEGGNTTVCTFTITVEDLTPPVAVCQDITIQLDANGNAMITAADVDGGSFDNCGVITGISIDIDTFDCSDLGDNPVVLSVTDDNGNVGTCTAIVTVEDVTAPDPVCLDITVQLDAAGTVTIVATDVDGGSTDACGIDTYSIDIDTFTCDDVGDNPVVLTVTDASGNSSSCTAIVTVEDVTDPVVTCMDIVVGLDENGEASIVPADVIASVTDACGFDTAALDISDFTCDDIGFVTVTVFVTDVNGNTSSCTAVVEVKDGIDPVLVCPADLTVEVDEGTSYTVPDFIADGTVTVTDNCTDPVTITTQDPAPGTILPEGVYPVTMTAEDDYGNGATCTFDLTVLGVLGVGNTFDISTIVMYPNPATTEVRISNPQNIALKEAIIFDVTGRLVGTYDLTEMGTDIGLDISQLATATYTVIIKGLEGGQLIKQLIKE